MLDITKACAPLSDQMNADDLLGEDRVITITDVKVLDTTEQPVHISYAGETKRVYKPCKSMLKLLKAAWGKDASQYIGRQLLLHNDPTVKWAGKPSGGIRILQMSNLAGPVSISLTITRGKRLCILLIHTLPLHQPQPILSPN